MKLAPLFRVAKDESVMIHISQSVWGASSAGGKQSMGEWTLSVCRADPKVIRQIAVLATMSIMAWKSWWPSIFKWLLLITVSQCMASCESSHHHNRCKPAANNVINISRKCVHNYCTLLAIPRADNSYLLHVWSPGPMFIIPSLLQEIPLASPFQRSISSGIHSDKLYSKAKNNMWVTLLAVSH
jgi:hypothetical protein